MSLNLQNSPSPELSQVVMIAEEVALDWKFVVEMLAEFTKVHE
jgi:hypothetical protein